MGLHISGAKEILLFEKGEVLIDYRHVVMIKEAVIKV